MAARPAAAAAQLRPLSRRSDWVWRGDVRAFYASVEHRVLFATVERWIKDRRLLELLRTIVEHGGAGRGIPVGSLTSQWFANKGVFS